MSTSTDKESLWLELGNLLQDMSQESISKMLGECFRNKTYDTDVRATPNELPSGFQWSICDVRDKGTCDEIYNLIKDRAIGPDDLLNDSSEYLQWALCPPGYFVDWHVGVRRVPSGELVGFVFAAPTTIRVQDVAMPMAALHYLYVHPLVEDVIHPTILFCEILRRVYWKGIRRQVSRWKLFMPTPVAVSALWELQLDLRKNQGLQCYMPELGRNIHDVRKSFTLKGFLRNPGIRRMRPSDVPAVTALLRDYLRQFAIATVFTEEDVNHWLLPRVFVLDSFVMEMSANNPEIICVFSYTWHRSYCGGRGPITVARLTYYATRTTLLPRGLIRDMILTARYHLCDLFVVDNFMKNATFHDEVPFEQSGQMVQLHINNYPMNVLPSSEVGISLP